MKQVTVKQCRNCICSGSWSKIVGAFGWTRDAGSAYTVRKAWESQSRCGLDETSKPCVKVTVKCAVFFLQLLEHLTRNFSLLTDPSHCLHLSPPRSVLLNNGVMSSYETHFRPTATRTKHYCSLINYVCSALAHYTQQMHRRIQRQRTWHKNHNLYILLRRENLGQY